MENIFAKVKLCSLTGCWNWTGTLNRNGYGRAWLNGKRRMVHKIMYEHIAGPVPEGLLLDHKCRNRKCCNPRHLEPVTPLENTLRGEAVLFRKQDHDRQESV